MYDWQRNPSGSVRDTLKRQKANTKSEFEERTKQTIAEFAEQVSNMNLCELSYITESLITYKSFYPVCYMEFYFLSICTALLQGLNAALFWEKVDFKEYIPMVPTSAITGDGMGDLIALLVTFSLKVLTKQLMLSMELEALVLEVNHVIPLII